MSDHHEKDKESDQEKKRVYKMINNKKRKELIYLITQKYMNIVDAAKEAGVNYENAKAIYRTYRQEGR